jgi:hypothetical protein
MNVVSTQTLIELLPIFNQLSADQFDECCTIIRTQLFPHFIPVSMDPNVIAGFNYETRTEQYMNRRNECCACDWSVIPLEKCKLFILAGYFASSELISYMKDHGCFYESQCHDMLFYSILFSLAPTPETQRIFSEVSAHDGFDLLKRVFARGRNTLETLHLLLFKHHVSITNLGGKLTNQEDSVDTGYNVAYVAVFMMIIHQSKRRLVYSSQEKIKELIAYCEHCNVDVVEFFNQPNRDGSSAFTLLQTTRNIFTTGRDLEFVRYLQEKHLM